MSKTSKFKNVFDDDDEPDKANEREPAEDAGPPYWNMYFPGENYYDVFVRSRVNRLFIEAFQKYFTEERQLYESSQQTPSKQDDTVKKVHPEMGDSGEWIVRLDYSQLCQLEIPSGDPHNPRELVRFQDELENQPNLTIARIEMAAHRAYAQQYEDNVRYTARIYNMPHCTKLRELKATQIGKFIQVKGTIVRVSNIKQVVTQMTFVCERCNFKMTRYFVENTFNPPYACRNKNCKSKKFEPDRYNAITVDWQRIRIQEVVEKDEQHDAGRIPRTVECEISKDLVESCVPGDQVTVCGVVKVISTDQNAEGGGVKGGGVQRGKAKCMYFLYLEGNSIANTKNNKQKGAKTDGLNDASQFSLTDLFMIREIASQDALFHLIVNSVCPAIYGHESVKAGLALSLFGGVQRYTNVKHKLPVRGDPHLLIVGDPGLGKSQLLTAISHVAPRGVYVCGNTTTTSGLTVTVVKDQGSGDFSLEAGALVLADQGCCCIDEFDKMRNEHQALLEAMEQQSISIAKAGIVCTLPARCSVIAAANPVGGHYNRAKTVSENLKISPALLSRFDLIFILLDSPDEARDELLSNHVMGLHAKTQNRAQHTQKTQMTQVPTDRNVPIKKRLGVIPKGFEPLPSVCLRKYISYARKYVHPKLSAEAKQILQEFYMSLREKHQSSDTTPITTRQLESLVRLAQARAKLELREIVTDEDAWDVVEIMKESLYDVLTDEYGQVDFRRNTGTSIKKESLLFVEDITRISNTDDVSIFSRDELYDIFKQRSKSGQGFDKMLDQLNMNGYLLKTGQNGRQYKLQTSNSASTPMRKSASSRRPASDLYMDY